MNQNANASTPSVPKSWIIGLAIACISFVLAESVYEKHGHVKYEDWFAFFAIAAVVGFGLMTGAGYLLRRPLQREDDYYDF